MRGPVPLCAVSTVDTRYKVETFSGALSCPTRVQWAAFAAIQLITGHHDGYSTPPVDNCVFAVLSTRGPAKLPKLNEKKWPLERGGLEGL